MANTPLSSENFNLIEAEKETKILFERLARAIDVKMEQVQRLYFVANSNSYGVPELIARILLPPSDTTSLALNKVSFFRLRSLDCLLGILGRLKEMRGTVAELIENAEINHRDYNEKFEIRTEEIREFWRGARDALRESLARFKELEPKHVVKPTNAFSMAQAGLGTDAELKDRLQKFSNSVVDSLITEVWHASRADFAVWKASTGEHIQAAGFEAFGAGDLARELQSTTKAKLGVAETRNRLNAEMEAFVRELADKARAGIFRGLVQCCREYRSDFERAARHSSEGEIFHLEARLRERCRREVGSTVEKYASIIDLYVAGINTAGNMQIIERAALARDIDFLQSEKIGKQEQIETSDRIFNAIFGSDHLKLSATETRCALFPEQLKALSGEAQAVISEGEKLIGDSPMTQAIVSTASMAKTWDEALQPVVSLFEKALSNQRAESLTALVGRYGAAAEEFETFKRQRMDYFARLAWVALAAGALLISAGLAIYYKFGGAVGQTPEEVVMWGVAANACWALVVYIFKRVNARHPRWALKRVDQFRQSGNSALATMKRQDVTPPPNLSEYRATAERSMGSAIAIMVMTAMKEAVASAQTQAEDVETIRTRGLALIQEYQKAWENGRATIDSMYRETGEKIAEFKHVAAVFKERTMDRTRELFGNRGHELDRLITELETLGRQVRELH